MKGREETSEVLHTIYEFSTGDTLLDEVLVRVCSRYSAHAGMFLSLTAGRTVTVDAIVCSADMPAPSKRDLETWSRAILRLEPLESLVMVDPTDGNGGQPAAAQSWLIGMIDRRDGQSLYLAVGLAPHAVGHAGTREVADLLPHLRRAFRARALSARDDAKRQTILPSVVDALPMATLVVDRAGSLLHANGSARELIGGAPITAAGAAGDVGWRMVADAGFARRLRDVAGSALTALPESLQHAGTATLVKRSGEQLPLVVVAVPLFEGGGERDGNVRDAAAALLMLHDIHQAFAIDQAAASLLFKLTPSEAHFAALAARGLRTEEICLERGISYHTARTHMKRVLAKVGVERQAELVRLLLNLPKRAAARPVADHGGQADPWLRPPLRASARGLSG